MSNDNYTENFSDAVEVTVAYHLTTEKKPAKITDIDTD